MYFSAPLKFYLAIALSLVVILAVGIAGISYPLGTIKSFNKKIFEERKKETSSVGQKNYKRELEKEVKLVDSYSQAINDLLLDQNKVLDFIIELEQIARDTNNTHSLSLIDNKGKDEDKLSFQVSSEASFSDLIKFIKAVENIRFQSGITFLNIQFASSENSVDKFRGSFILKVNTR